MLRSRFLPFDYTWLGLEAAQPWQESGMKVGEETLQGLMVSSPWVTQPRPPRADLAGACRASGSPGAPQHMALSRWIFLEDVQYTRSQLPKGEVILEW